MRSGEEGADMDGFAVEALEGVAGALQCPLNSFFYFSTLCRRVTEGATKWGGKTEGREEKGASKMRVREASACWRRQVYLCMYKNEQV